MPHPLTEIITMSDALLSVSFEHEDGNLHIAANHPEMVELYDTLRSFGNSLALSAFTFDRDEMDPEQYEYIIDTQDGRLWKQVIIMDNPNNPRMNFNQVTGLWRLSEFAPHRALRDLVIRLVNDLHAIKVEAHWYYP